MGMIKRLCSVCPLHRESASAALIHAVSLAFARVSSAIKLLAMSKLLQYMVYILKWGANLSNTAPTSSGAASSKSACAPPCQRAGARSGSGCAKRTKNSAFNDRIWSRLEKTRHTSAALSSDASVHDRCSKGLKNTSTAARRCAMYAFSVEMISRKTCGPVAAHEAPPQRAAA